MQNNDFLENQLVNMLCEGTTNIMLDLYQNNFKGKKVTTRGGSGRSTYHTLKTSNHHSITYGVKMVGEIIYFKSLAKNWLQAKEIKRRNYVNKTITPQTMLIHTVMHEFAHAIQVSDNKRFYKSVHNKHFYNILDDMYKQEVHKKLSNYFSQYDIFNNLEYKNEKLLKEKIKKQQKMINKSIGSFTKLNIPLYSTIEIKHKNQKLVLKVLRLNKSRITAETLYKKEKYYVPYQMVERCY